MKVIPVADILGGKIVHGVRGDREFYKPVESVLTVSCHPLDIAGVFKNQLMLDDIYIADLDSIEGTGDNFGIVRDIKDKLGIKIFLDPGIKDPQDLRKDAVRAADCIVLGTETLNSLRAVYDAVSLKGSDNVAVSVDIKGGGAMCNIGGFSSIKTLIREMRGLGVGSFIVLDLDRVGTMEGPSGCARELIAAADDLDAYVITGGGVRSVEDAACLQAAGADAVLIATALHTGKISEKDLNFISRL